MRFFLGIAIPEEVKLRLSKQLLNFVEEYPYFSFIPMDNYHITIEYFGEQHSIEKIDKHIQESLYDIPPFQMYPDGTAMFMKHQITMYISFSRQKLLEVVAERIAAAAHAEHKKDFVPHLTFAKYKVPSKQQYLLIKKKLSLLEIDAPFEVNKLILYESVPAGKQIRYIAHKEYPLLKEE